jgi:hypothetical protein
VGVRELQKIVVVGGELMLVKMMMGGLRKAQHQVGNASRVDGGREIEAVFPNQVP